MCVDENEDTIVLCLDSLFCPSSPACSDAVSHEWTMPKQPSSRLQYCVLCWCLAPVRPGHDPKLDYWMCRIKVQHWTQTWGSDSEVIWNGLGRTIMKGLKWTTHTLGTIMYHGIHTCFRWNNMAPVSILSYVMKLIIIDATERYWWQVVACWFCVSCCIIEAIAVQQELAHMCSKRRAMI